jgi:hypothetical protein
MEVANGRIVGRRLVDTTIPVPNTTITKIVRTGMTITVTIIAMRATATLASMNHVKTSIHQGTMIASAHTMEETMTDTMTEGVKGNMETLTTSVIRGKRGKYAYFITCRKVKSRMMFRNTTK